MNKKMIIRAVICSALIVLSAVIVFLCKGKNDEKHGGMVKKLSVQVAVGMTDDPTRGNFVEKIEKLKEKLEQEIEEDAANEKDKEEDAAEPGEIKDDDEKTTGTPSPTTKVEVIPGQHRDPNSAVVVIDPGHQRQGDSTKEPNGPGSSIMKARVSSGTRGVSTGVYEYVLNLDISLKLKQELENRGYTVYMTRSTHDVNISNKERAEYAGTVGADIAVRIHANGASSAGVKGAETLVPSNSNAYVSHLASASQSLGRCILDEYCEAAGFDNRGVKANDTMTGINWSTVPVAIIELGFMSNGEEDMKMQDASIQNNMVQGIANGIDKYFGF